MRIDTHVHITPPDVIANWECIAEKEAYFSLLSYSKNNHFATAEQVVEEMDRCGIQRAVVFPFAFSDMGLCRYGNDYAMEAVKKYPDRLTGFMAVVPGPEAEREIERCYDGGLYGVGELFPEGQPFSLADKRDTEHLAGACIERNIPVLLHVNEPVGHYYPGKVGTTLQEMQAFITNHPELITILAHWGGGLPFYELMKEMRETLKNVYYDNAASIFLYSPAVYRVAETLGIADKLLFGSDFPLVSPSRYEKGIAESGMSEDAKEKLLGGNAEALLRHIGAIK